MNFRILSIVVALAMFLQLSAGTLNARTNVVASQYSSNSWDLEDGINSNWVTGIATKRGEPEVWVGTPIGIVRFDGVDFEVFDVTDSELLAGGVWALENDAKGNLLIGTRYHGIVQFDSGTFQSVHHSDLGSFPEVRVICSETEGRTWIGSPQGLYFVENSKYVHFEHSILSTAFIVSILCDSKGFVWIGTQDHGLFRIKSSNFKDVIHFKEYNTVYCIEEDLTGAIWVGSKKGLHRFIESAHSATLQVADGLPSNSVRSLFLDSAGCLVVGTERGIVRIVENKVVTNWQNEPFANSFINCFYEDSEKSLWVGTKYGGLGQLWKGKFRVYSTGEGLIHSVVNAVCERNKGGIWLGTNGGLQLLENGAVKTVFEESIGTARIRDVFEDSRGVTWISSYSGLFKIDGETITRLGVEDGLTSNLVRHVEEDRFGQIWVGTRSGLVRFNKDGEVEKWKTPELKNDFILHIFKDRNQNIWIATDGGGIARFKNDQFEWFDSSNGLVNDVVFKIHQDSDGIYWLATASGVSVFDGTHFRTIDSRDGLPSETIFQVLEDPYGSMWFTAHEGIFRVVKENLQSYLDGDIETFVIKRYGPLDGLRTYQMTGVGESCLVGNSQLCFSTADGIALVDLAAINRENPNPNVYFKSILCNGEEFLIESLEDQDFDFGKGIKTLEIIYSADSLIGASNILFQKQLIGFDDNDTETHSRTATYTNLAPGDYRFEISARHGDGQISSEKSEISFRIRPYFHQTIWFYVSIAAISFAVGYLLYVARIMNLRTRRIGLERKIADRTEEISLQKEVIQSKVLEHERTLRNLQAANLELKKLNEEKSFILGIAAHDLKNPLGNIQFLSQELAEKHEGKDDEDAGFAKMIHQSTEELLQLVESLIHSVSLETGKIVLEKELEDVSSIAESVIGLNKAIADEKQLTIRVDVPEGITGYVDLLRLRTAMDNFISNAIKYTPCGGAIWVSLIEVHGIDKKRCEFKVKDSGPGLQEEDFKKVFERFAKLSARPTGGESSTGLGLSIVKQIIELHGGNVYVRNNDEGGAEFSFSLPLA